MMHHQFQKNELVNIFSRLCDHIADNLYDIVMPNLDNELEMITPLFEDAHIKDTDDWWAMDNHLGKWIAHLTGLESEMEGSLSDTIQNGIDELQEDHPDLHRALLELCDTASFEEVIKYIPHNAEYSQVLKETDGYKNLDKKLLTLNNVVAWPMFTVGPNTGDLKSAFYLNVAILSADNKPLKPKIKLLNPTP